MLAVFAPFAVGYFLSYLFRTIAGPMSDRLIGAFGLGPRDLGVLTSVYFLAFAAFQIPAGLLIDRYGPRLVQAALLAVAALGAALFALAPDRGTLMLGRALIGLGTSAALVSGLKALALWLPAERRVTGNAWLISCGGLGAMASTVPVDLATGVLDWRGIFGVLAAATLVVASVVWRCVPEAPRAHVPDARETWRGLGVVFGDARFWGIAPLSASVVGAAFAIHGLWAARWLADARHVAAGGVGLDLLAMGACLTGGAAMFGALARLARRFGVSTTALFAGCGLVFMTIEAGIATGVAVPPVVLLGAFATFGAITVLSFSIVGGLFPTELVGRANGALNVLHLGTAFLMQAGIGAVVEMWAPGADGHVPAAAYAVAFLGVIAVQAVAFIWFVVSTRGRREAARRELYFRVNAL